MEMHIEVNLKSIMSEYNLSVKQVADITGMSQSHVINIREGRRKLKLESLAKIAKYIGVEPFELVKLIINEMNN